ncbi:MAG: hypothetical protein KKH98_06485, partial [Spirochaetes bacterium]|nr:hypothetical protein [Spirochaetota bacterium]
LLVSLYGLLMLYNAIVQSLKGKEPTVKIIAIVLTVIVIFGSISSMVAYKSVSSVTKGVMKDMKDWEKNSEKATELMKKYMKEYKEEEKE